MSETEEHEAELSIERFESNTARFVKVLWVVGSLMFAVGVWSATQQVMLAQNFQEDARAHGEVKKIHTAIEDMDRWRIATEATRYTMRDHGEYEREQSEIRLLQEKRLQRLEDNQQRITELLDSIDQKLDRIP